MQESEKSLREKARRALLVAIADATEEREPNAVQHYAVAYVALAPYGIDDHEEPNAE